MSISRLWQILSRAREGAIPTIVNNADIHLVYVYEIGIVFRIQHTSCGQKPPPERLLFALCLTDSALDLTGSRRSRSRLSRGDFILGPRGSSILHPGVHHEV